VSAVLSVVVAAVVVFVLSSVYYVVATPFERARLGARAVDRGSQRPQPWKVGLELLRNLILSGVIAGLVRYSDITSVGPTVVLGLVLFVGFPLILLTGSVIWEKTPVATVVLHAGDWLMKLLVIAVIVGLWL
jgi:hypothetical protein